MAKPEHLAKLKEGVKAWNEWRASNLLLIPNLNGANLNRADLSEADLINASLREANLISVSLREADLRGADLSEADLINASLRKADLRGADLSEANLINANLHGADLSRANLSRANLSRTNVDGTRFAATIVGGTAWCDMDLSETAGLESIEHLRPSSVGIDTLVKSKGRIPEVFLRGCGVPEHIIAMQKSLVGDISPIQFYSCFISYSHRDEEFCQRLHSRMQQEGLRVWYAPEEMKGGRKLHEQIDEAIRVYDKLLVVLSEASMGSEWVVTEILKARKRERRDNRQVLFPIGLVDFEAIRAWECFDADSAKDVAHEIREYFIPDFSNWKNHDEFEAAFARLLKDLKASA